MSTDLEPEQAERAKDLIRSYYADELLKKVKAAAAAQQEALAAAEALQHFNTTGKVTGDDDAFLIAVWAGSRTIRDLAQELGGTGARSATEQAAEERLWLLKWLVGNGYDIRDVFAAEARGER